MNLMTESILSSGNSITCESKSEAQMTNVRKSGIILSKMCSENQCKSKIFFQNKIIPVFRTFVRIPHLSFRFRLMYYSSNHQSRTASDKALHTCFNIFKALAFDKNNLKILILVIEQHFENVWHFPDRNVFFDQQNRCFLTIFPRDFFDDVFL